MRKEYFRPSSLAEALDLLKKPGVRPLAGGGTFASKRVVAESLVDLQDLDLDNIIEHYGKITIGATTRLQQLFLSPIFPDSFHLAVRLENSLNRRNSSTIGGLLMSENGRSPLLACLLALDISLTFEPGGRSKKLDKFFETRSIDKDLIIALAIEPFKSFAFEYLSRTPFDRPFLCSAMTLWPDGRMTLALGGYGLRPFLVQVPANIDELPEKACQSMLRADDEWAPADYRSAMTEVIVRRNLISLSCS
jgi:CO/xanthine dehydrogenase FAD-binding subunit